MRPGKAAWLDGGTRRRPGHRLHALSLQFDPRWLAGDVPSGALLQANAALMIDL